MRPVLILLIWLAIGFTPGCALHRSAEKSLAEKRAREKEARAAATEWLGLIDKADYPAAYALEAKRLRAATTEEQFVRSMESRRAPFGKMQSRTFIGAAFTRKMTGGA